MMIIFGRVKRFVSHPCDTDECWKSVAWSSECLLGIILPESCPNIGRSPSILQQAHNAALCRDTVKIEVILVAVGFFALAEYIEVFVVCGVGAALFLGGSNLPVDLTFDILPLQLVQVVIFMTKALPFRRSLLQESKVSVSECLYCHNNGKFYA